MRSAEQSELHQDKTHSLAASPANGVQQPGTDILTPLASRSLFWRARYLEASPALCHIPLLFWLTETARPRIAVTLGVADAVPHFALCQAVDKLGLDSLCIGVEDTALNAETTSFNQRNYEDFSHFAKASGETPEFLPLGREADLLIVNRPASKALISALSSTWQSRLSDQSIILFLHGPEAGAEAAFQEAFLAEDKVFSLGLHGPASLVIHGSNQPERLQRLVQLNPGHPGYIAASTVFRRLGELHSKSCELEQATAELTQARQNAALNAAELQKAQAQLKSQTDQKGPQSKLHQDLTQARQQNSLLHEELTTFKHRLPSLEEETQHLRKLLTEQEETLSERYTDIAALGLEIETVRIERERAKADSQSLQQEIADLKEQLSAAKQQCDQFAERVHALENSTSWRVTAPLRKASLTFRSK